MQLNPFERALYAKLLEIETLLRKDGDDRNAISVDALLSGYPDFYNLEAFSEELARDDSDYVMGVFDMYWYIQQAFKASNMAIPDAAKMPGFDGNAPDRLFGYASFLIRYHQVESVEGTLNSHGFQANYRPMLEKFGELMETRDPGDNISVEEANDILEVGKDQ